jgi:hypothetical protein
MRDALPHQKGMTPRYFQDSTKAHSIAFKAVQHLKDPSSPVKIIPSFEIDI